MLFGLQPTVLLNLFYLLKSNFDSTGLADILNCLARYSLAFVVLDGDFGWDNLFLVLSIVKYWTDSPITFERDRSLLGVLTMSRILDAFLIRGPSGSSF